MEKQVKYRYATLEDFKKFYKDDPMHYSTRAVVVEKDGEPVGIGGVCRVDNKMLVFTEMRPGQVSKRDIVMAGRLLMKIINRYTSVFAFLDKDSATAVSFGAHYGFEKTGVVLSDGEVLMRVNR
jgi:hypothetical protein